MKAGRPFSVRDNDSLNGGGGIEDRNEWIWEIDIGGKTTRT